jgi:uncharacterized membrane protein YedE/YeeE
LFVNIAWDQFTPWASLIGGLLIGLASVLYVMGAGRIAGISGIVGIALRQVLGRVPLGRDPARWGFIGGMLVSPWIWQIVAPLPKATSDASVPLLIVAGLLVGFGSRMGSGCTSGHGVCGLSRFSGRSLANVLAFMGAGFATVFLIRHVMA